MECDEDDPRHEQDEKRQRHRKDEPLTEAYLLDFNRFDKFELTNTMIATTTTPKWYLWCIREDDAEYTNEHQIRRRSYQRRCSANRGYISHRKRQRLCGKKQRNSKRCEWVGLRDYVLSTFPNPLILSM